MGAVREGINPFMNAPMMLIFEWQVDKRVIYAPVKGF